MMAYKINAIFFNPVLSRFGNARIKLQIMDHYGRVILYEITGLIFLLSWVK